jgi:hypothetical protein
MIGTIRKHQTWLWAIIITVTIISFVIFFSPYSKLNASRRGPANYGSIEGEKVTEDQFAQTEREVYLRYFFMNGSWPDEEAKKSGFDPMQATYYRLLLIMKEDQLGVHVNSEICAQFARDLLRSYQRMGINSPIMFVQQILEPRGFHMDDLERFIRHEMGIQELAAILGLSGQLITPAEAKGLYEREHQELATEVLFFSASNYLANASAAPEAISQFYSNNLASYRIPDRVQVSYVKFPVTNLLAQAEAELSKTNLDEIVEANLQRLGTNYVRIAKSPAEAKLKIHEELIRERAMSHARKTAVEFATPLFDIEPMRAENLDKLAKEKGLTVNVTAPFNREGGPQDLDVGTDFVKAAFLRTADDPFCPPLVGRDGVYVIAFNKRIPSEVPSLAKIQARVVGDYKYNQATMLARIAGQSFYSTLTNRLTQGKTFSAICAEANLRPVELPPFSISTRVLSEFEERLSLNELKQMAFSTLPGKVSSFQPIIGGGAILFVKARLPLDQVKMQADLPAYVGLVRQQRQNEAFNQWFNRELQRTMRDTPLSQPKPPPSYSPRSAKKS